MRHLIDPMDLSVEDIDRLLDRADDIAKNPGKYQEVCKHKLIHHLHLKEKVLQIQQESLNVMQISLRCVIQRKEHHM